MKQKENQHNYLENHNMSIQATSIRKYKGIQSIHRAAAILRVVAAQNGIGIRLSAISRELGLKHATAHRILSSLADEGLINFNRFSKHYYLGFKLVSLGRTAFQGAALEICQRAVENLASATEDTVFLFIRFGADGLCIRRVEGNYPVRTLTINEGDMRPLGIGAGSLALLAFLDDKEIEKIITFNCKEYKKYKNHTPDDVRNYAKNSRALGYAWCGEGAIIDYVSAVGLPIRDTKGHIVASISIGAIPDRMSKERISKILNRMREEIHNINFPAKISS